MKIKGKTDNQSLNCEVCIQGKFVQTRNRNPDRRAEKPLKLVHTDVAGPIDPLSRDGHRYTLLFINDFSGAVFVYFLKNKSEPIKQLNSFWPIQPHMGQTTAQSSWQRVTKHC